MDEVNDIYANRGNPDRLTREHAIDAVDAAIETLHREPTRTNADKVHQCWRQLLRVIGGPSAVG